MPKWWDWEDAWGILLITGAAILIGMLIRSATADHRIRSYYVQAGSSSACVMADVDWDTNTTAYCSDDMQKVLATLQKLNDELRGRQK